MSLKRYKPTTPGQRQLVNIDRSELWKGRPLKALTHGKTKNGGRNNNGRITSFNKGGGHKQLYRTIDFKRDKLNITAIVERLEYDPNRSAYIMLAVYADGEKRYVIAPKGMKVDDKFVVSEDAPIELGNRLILRNIPVGTFVHNVETKPKGGAKLARSAGNFLQVVANDNGYTSIKMPSTEVRKVVDSCWATIGTVSNDEWKLTNFGKAGRNRHRGIRPTVRGSVMNPVDHPHGGGEGKQGIGLRRGPKTRQGKLAYGVKTRRAKKYSNRLIVNRRKTKR